MGAAQGWAGQGGASASTAGPRVLVFLTQNLGSFHLFWMSVSQRLLPQHPLQLERGLLLQAQPVICTLRCISALRRGWLASQIPVGMEVVTDLWTPTSFVRDNTNFEERGNITFCSSLEFESQRLIIINSHCVTNCSVDKTL